LKEAGLSYQKPRRSAAEADEDEQEAFFNSLDELTTVIDTALKKSQFQE